MRSLIFLLTTVYVIGPSNAQVASLGRDEFVAAIQKAAGGFSVDEVLIDDQRRETFLGLIHESINGPMPVDEQRDALLRMLKLRKTGKLSLKTTRRSPAPPTDVAAVAEIASRVVTDRHRVSSDTMLADPNLRRELQDEAGLIRPGIDAYAVRKSVLGLRKKRALRPELVLKVADWGRSIETLSIDELADRLSDGSISSGPGVYLFRGDRGYLYVGEASNLQARLSEHVGGSDRLSLADYLAGNNGHQVTVEMHVFPEASPARKVTVRRAYESELIRSRQPAFNVRP